MRKIVMTLVLAVLTVAGMKADTYSYLNFVNASDQITQFGTTGLRVTFSGGKATVTAGGKTQTISLTSMAYMEFSNTQSGGTTYAAGDVNGDGTVDVADINILINIILGNDDGDDYDGRQYVTDDEAVDIADINALINLMLNAS